MENHKCDNCPSFFRNTGTEPPQEAIGPIGSNCFLREVLISAFVVGFWKLSYLNLLPAKFHFFKIVSVPEETGLSLGLSVLSRRGPINRLEMHMVVLVCCNSCTKSHGM